ncbi:MAG: DUF6226 family protein [Candidatus Sulfotelmatobacter sp.]
MIAEPNGLTWLCCECEKRLDKSEMLEFGGTVACEECVRSYYEQANSVDPMIQWDVELEVKTRRRNAFACGSNGTGANLRSRPRSSDIKPENLPRQVTESRLALVGRLDLRPALFQFRVLALERKAYSRVTNPERFASLHDSAAGLLQRLEREFELQRRRKASTPIWSTTAICRA